MKYERLTKRNKNGSAIPIKSPKSDNIATVQEEWAVLRQEIYNRLAELEDKIENGTLIELPCKVGDTVYMPWVYDGVSGMAILIVEDIDIRNKYIKTNLESDWYSFLVKYNFGVFSWEAFGKTVFLTKAEAEQRLKELQNE